MNSNSIRTPMVQVPTSIEKLGGNCPACQKGFIFAKQAPISADGIDFPGQGRCSSCNNVFDVKHCDVKDALLLVGFSDPDDFALE